jgi:tetratricopeptide (TPR) repeat protein
MFGWFRAKCPVSDDARQWIERRMSWLTEEFGRERLLKVRVVVPTAECFPAEYDGSYDAATTMFLQVCQYMEVPEERVALRFFSDDRPDFGSVVGLTRTNGAAGLYHEEEDGTATIWLQTRMLDDPMGVVATFAHELAHVHLLGDGRIAADVDDHEPLTDLLTVFFGLGVFTANSVIREKYWNSGTSAGWQIGRQGYLGGTEFGYALALFAWLRDEKRPSWASHMRLDVSVPFKAGLKFLSHSGIASFTPAGEPDAPGDDDSDQQRLMNGNDESAEPRAESEDTNTEDTQSDDLLGLGRVDNHFACGLVCVREGNYQQAAEAFSEAIRLRPHDVEALEERAQTYLLLRRYHDALADCDRAIILDSSSIAAHCCRGMVRVHSGEYSSSLADFQRALRLDGHYAAAYYGRGLAYAGLGNYARAVADYGRALHHGTLSPEIFDARSMAFDQLGRPVRAQADREKARRLEQAR